MKLDVIRRREKTMSKRTVVYPGSFNPITNGHTDLVERALHLFDHVVLAIGTSINKDPKVDLADRIALCEKVLAQYGDLSLIHI